MVDVDLTKLKEKIIKCLEIVRACDCHLQKLVAQVKALKLSNQPKEKLRRPHALP